MKAILLIIFILFSLIQQGCGPTSLIPQRFATFSEAYSDVGNKGDYIPTEAYINKVYNASYDDVYRAAKISVSQSFLYVDDENYESGVIFATQLIKEIPNFETCVNHTFNLMPQQRILYYAIVVAEIEPKKTSVSISAKTQGQCYLGICIKRFQENCKAFAQVRWATGKDNAQEILKNYIVMLDNNLIQSGIL